MTSAKDTQLENRRKASAAALASVRAQRLHPSRSLKLLLQRYADGKISATQLRRETLKEVRARAT